MTAREALFERREDGDAAEYDIYLSNGDRMIVAVTAWWQDSDGNLLTVHGTLHRQGYAGEKIILNGPQIQFWIRK